MTTKMILEGAVLPLLLLLATFITAAVTENDDDDLVFDPDFQTPSIGRYRQNAHFHRIKRGIFDFFSNASLEETTAEEPQISGDPPSFTTGDTIQHLLEAVETKLAGTDELNESVKRLTGAIKDLDATNRSLIKKIPGLRVMDVELSRRLDEQNRRIAELRKMHDELSRRLEDQNRRITHLE